MMNSKKLLKIAVLCVVSAFGNILGSLLHTKTGLPLYIDTIFNAAICFSAGLVPALVTATLVYPVMDFLVNRYIRILPVELGFFANVWVICMIVEIILIWLFYKKMKEEEAVFLENPSPRAFTGAAVLLLVLSVLDCVVISVTGGIIDYVLTVSSMPRSFSPEDYFKLGLLRNNIPLLATTILSRVPINIVDRFIVIFGGYGVSLLYRKWINNIITP
jgi:uncharacterized membrane protein